MERSRLFWPVSAAAQAFSGFADWPSIEDYDRAVGAGLPVAIREQPPRPKRRRGREREVIEVSGLYEGRIHLEGWLPTRPRSWHDFFNLLVWASFPRAKRQLSARQAATLAQWVAPGVRELPGRRTREQDGLAILDEGGLLLLVEAGAAGEVREGLAGRAAGPVAEAIGAGRAVALLFGHAVYEQIARGGPPVRAMTEVLEVAGALPREAQARVALADARLHEVLEDPESFCRPETFRSLPVEEGVLLGGPG
ncbi:DUF3025 domain-containing protein [Chondromyces apiculatus]|uniref:Transmembrane protein n=1 Tax=Chondromyces apiculatus DSM 436 TaxID=1192034 RepID=A0A017T0Q6_9BACT|nr:DUF3025 domain-containing protein [Chondromyces apiculatus]EYF02537.1 Hypothetical protein CAP_6744 [Chondromyces apiculatus DSM 436]